MRRHHQILRLRERLPGPLGLSKSLFSWASSGGHGDSEKAGMVYFFEWKWGSLIGVFSVEKCLRLIALSNPSPN